MGSEQGNKRHPVKKIGDLNYSTHEASGYDKLNADGSLTYALEAVASKRKLWDKISDSILSGYNEPAAIKIADGDGRSIIAIGYKKFGDQEDLKIFAAKLDQNDFSTPPLVINFKEPFVVHFDKETDDSKKVKFGGKVKGTIDNSSVNLLIEKIKSHPDLGDDKGTVLDFLKNQPTVAKIVDEKNFPNLAMAKASDSPKSPTVVAVVKPLNGKGKSTSLA